MATQVNTAGMRTFVAHGSALAANALTVALPTVSAGTACVIDTITASFSGTVNVTQTLLIQVAGGGSTRWQTYYHSTAAGLGLGVFAFVNGLKFQDGESLEVTGASLSNSAQKISVSGHLEMSDRTSAA